MSEPNTQPIAAQTNQLAVISFALGIAAVVLLGFIAGIPAVILGHKALRELQISGEGGRTFALVGLVLGWVNIALTILGGLLILVLLASR